MKKTLRKLFGTIPSPFIPNALSFSDPSGKKGMFELFCFPPPHIIRHISLTIEGWPRLKPPLKIAYLSDLHTGSHSGDIPRLRKLLSEIADFSPHVFLLGGDYVNMQRFGGGRVPPETIANLLSTIKPPCGTFAVLGNHDHQYGAKVITSALTGRGIVVLDGERTKMNFQGTEIDVLGLPHTTSPGAGDKLLRELDRSRPSIVIGHDPIWFAKVPTGPYLTLAGHTHGGQIRLPYVGPLTNMSQAPMRWSHGLIKEQGRFLYVTSGIGTSMISLRWGVPPEIVIFEITG